MSTNKLKPVNLHLPAEILEAAEKLAQRLQTSRSAILRAALIRGLREENIEELSKYVMIQGRKVEEYDRFTQALTAFLQEKKTLTLYYCRNCGKVVAARVGTKHPLCCPLCGSLCSPAHIKPRDLDGERAVLRGVVLEIKQILDEVRDMLSRLLQTCGGYMPEEVYDKLRDAVDKLSEIYESMWRIEHSL